MYPKMTVNLCKWTIPPAFVLLFIQKSSKLITISPEMNEHNKLCGCYGFQLTNAVYMYTGPNVIYGNNVTGLSGETFHGIC